MNTCAEDALLLFRCLFAVGFLGTVIGQARQGRAAAAPQAIPGTWAIGSIRTADVKLFQVKALLGWDAADDAAVCDYAFADLAGDGFYRLLVSADYSGRRWCNNLEIISYNGTATQEIDIWNVEHIADILVKDSGQDTLRVPRPLTDYKGIERELQA